MVRLLLEKGERMNGPGLHLNLKWVENVLHFKFHRPQSAKTMAGDYRSSRLSTPEDIKLTTTERYFRNYLARMSLFFPALIVDCRM